MVHLSKFGQVDVMCKETKITDISKGCDRTTNVEARLKDVLPSSDILTYYRQKVDSLAMDHEHFQHRLNQIADAISDQQHLQQNCHAKDREVNQLQQALAEMQAFVYKERDHVLRLYAENDRLKIRELDYRRKIQHLLQLSGVGPIELTYFLTEIGSQFEKSDDFTEFVTSDSKKEDIKSSALIINPINSVNGTVEGTLSNLVKHGNASYSANMEKGDGAQRDQSCDTISRLQHLAVLRELESTRLVVKALHCQLEEHTKNSRDQLDMLLAEQQNMHLARKNEIANVQNKEITMQNQLRRCQHLLHKSTQELLSQRQQFRQAEKDWIAEKDRLLTKLGTTSLTLKALPPSKRDMGRSVPTNLITHNTAPLPCSGTMSMPNEVLDDLTHNCECGHKKTLNNLEFQLGQQQKLADMYREQVSELEENLLKTREESGIITEAYNEQTAKLNKRIQLTNQRYQDLERRRNLEVQGYQADISSLRKKLNEVEKRLLKMSLGVTKKIQPTGAKLQDIDLQILKHVCNTSTRSKVLADELKHLKSVMYELEDKMRKL